MTHSKTGLATLGWRVNTAARLDRAIKDFQRSWNLGPALKVDGIAGPKTNSALEVSLARKAKGLGDLSEHFSGWEFKCGCGGRWDDCRRIWPLRSLVQAAEAYRRVIGPFTPERACRCNRQNAAVSGAKNSQHLYGAALDVPAVLPPNRLRDLKVASGIGIYRTSSHDVVRHFDVRHASGSGVAGSITHPAAWDYGKLKDRNGRLVPAPPLPKQLAGV